MFLYILIKEFLLKNVRYLSIFEKHKQTCSQTHFNYSLKNDTWLVTSDYIDDSTGDYHLVNSIETLRSMFEYIKIAKGDELYIGNKKITSVEAPDLF